MSDRPILDPITLRWIADELSAEAVARERALKSVERSSLWKATGSIVIHEKRMTARWLRNLATRATREEKEAESELLEQWQQRERTT